MIERLENIDREIFLFFNGINSELFDFLMWHITARWFWIPVIVVFILFIIKDHGKKAWLPLIIFVICFALTDQGSYQMKHFVQRYRPTHNIELEGLVHIVNEYRGGLYGFFSGHTASSFGLFALTSLLVKRKPYTYAILFWAVIVSYSRIYLGVHYPSDIVAGLIWGLFVALIMYKLYGFIHNQIYSNKK